MNIFDTNYIPPDRKDFLRLEGLIEANFKSQRDPGFYIVAMGYTKFRLNKLSRMYASKTVYEMVQVRIHEEAEKLLLYTSLTVTQITYELGLQDASWFVKCFKKRTGMCPRVWRMRNLAFG